MQRRDFLKASAATLGAIAFPGLGQALRLENFPLNSQNQPVARGYVFHNKSNSIKKLNNPGIANVYVSNGIDIVKTDRNGFYEIPIQENSTLFVIKPSGWAVPTNKNNLPQHYYIHNPAGSPARKYDGIPPTGRIPESIDFGLTPQKEDRKFKMIMCGDPQPRNQTEIDFMAHDVIEHITREAQLENAKFGISLGDIMFDNLEFYESLNRTFASVGIPWHNVVGNHDLNYDSPTNELSTETFKRHYGTPYYAFNYGQVHFIILNNVYWRGSGEDRGYHGEFTKPQLEFVKNDLATIPKDRLITICMHIPFLDTRDKNELLELIKDRPNTVSFSAHTHVAEHFFIGQEEGFMGKEPHHHVNHSTVCGCWWGGAYDERGIPHATMGDGEPNGYSIIEFDGNKYKISARAASRPASYQMSIWLPEEVDQSVVESKTVIVNVFAGSRKSKVEIKVGDSNWAPMENFVGQDPFMLEIKKLEAAEKPPLGRKTAGVENTPHLWKSQLPALETGTYTVKIRTTDMFGQNYTDSRIIRVK